MSTHYPGQQIEKKSQQAGQSAGFGLPATLVINLAIFLLIVSSSALTLLGQINSRWGIIAAILLGVVGVGINLPPASVNLSDIRKAFLALFAQIVQTTETVRHRFFSKSDTWVQQALLPGSPFSSSPYDNIFVFNRSLPNPDEFYGRTGELKILIDRVQSRASTTIIGERRIGKTWLLECLQQLAPQVLGPTFRIGSLDATKPSCSSVSGFCETALEKLCIPLSSPTADLQLLDEGIKGLIADHLIPVLCIDEFEGFEDVPEFDLDFFYALRAMSSSGLVLIVASRVSLLDFTAGENKLSHFYNIFEQLNLGPFNREEAETFARAKCEQASFTEQEYDKLLFYGKEKENAWPPVLLQLVGKTLVDDKLRAAVVESSFYRPTDPVYWQSFKEQIQEQYEAIK